MRITVPRETQPGERRVALVPESVRKLTKAGVEVAIETSAGDAAFFADAAYQEAGAMLVADRRELLASADLLLTVQPPERSDIDVLRTGAMLLGTLLPTRNLEVVRALAGRGVTAFSTDAIPRITRAQAMDTLSSMASLGGYRAVLLAAYELDRYFPMFMTAAGTVLPAKVLVIGAGVAGLQAIATARRLGAAVEATDTRPAARGDIESLGAKFVGVDAGEAAQDAGGYAKELSAEFYRKQGELIAQRCAASDVVITTALIGGVKAPRLITAETVKGMRPGSVIVDLAAPAGGNCELTEPGRTVVHDGVKICGPLNLPSDMASHGSLLYSRNLTAFVLAFWKDGKFNLDLEDDILKAAVITHEGRIVHAPTQAAMDATAGSSD